MTSFFNSSSNNAPFSTRPLFGSQNTSTAGGGLQSTTQNQPADIEVGEKVARFKQKFDLPSILNPHKTNQFVPFITNSPPPPHPAKFPPPSRRGSPHSRMSRFDKPETSTNVARNVQVPQTPDDTVQALKFNPVVAGMPILLAAGAWDNTCRVWQVNESTGAIEPKAMQNVQAPILSIDWVEDSSKLFIASADKMARMWDLASNQLTVVGEHEQPIRSCHWIAAINYNALMTCGWDKTLRFWDMRQLPTKNSLATIQLPERVYCSDVLYPMAVIGLANRHIKIYNLDGQPSELNDTESPLKFQSRCISVFKNKDTNRPAGYALGSIEGRVAIQYAETANPKDNFTFKCHRSPELVNNYQEIYVVNDVTFHPQHYTLATAGSDGRFSFWDKDARTKLKTSEPPYSQAITKCHVHGGGNIFAYAIGYDWSKGHEGNSPTSGSKIYLHPCGEDMKPRKK